jgi:REP element-mobilizing transposase RayT
MRYFCGGKCGGKTDPPLLFFENRPSFSGTILTYAATQTMHSPRNAVPHHPARRGWPRNILVRRRSTHLPRLLRLNLNDAGVRLLGWCLMTNHVHLIAVPERSDSLSILLRRAHGLYAQYYNARYEHAGHLLQNRFFACLLGTSHLWTALAYVERNPLRAKTGEAARRISLVERPGARRRWRRNGTTRHGLVAQSEACGLARDSQCRCS